MAVSLENVLRSRIANTIVLAAMAYGITSTLRYVLKSAPGSFVTGSPLKTLLPNLSEQAKAQLPYPSDALPGARDVPSPYGSIRVYEWGPESGRKVLLVHGISTPCVSLRDIAHVLVENGCRVMLFDLYAVSLAPDTHILKTASCSRY